MRRGAAGRPFLIVPPARLEEHEDQRDQRDEQGMPGTPVCPIGALLAAHAHDRGLELIRGREQARERGAGAFGCGAQRDQIGLEIAESTRVRHGTDASADRVNAGFPAAAQPLTALNLCGPPPRNKKGAPQRAVFVERSPAFSAWRTGTSAAPW